MDWSPESNEFPTVLTIRKPADGSYRYATTGWPGMLTAFTALYEHGIYLDVHDGTSMGGSVIYLDRPSILNSISDMVAESASLEAIVRRLNGAAISASMILNLADASCAASVGCSSLAGNRVRLPKEDSLVGVNTFLNPDWRMHKRETVSNSLRRSANMTARIAESKGEIDAAKTRELMDLRLLNEDGSFAENGGSKADEAGRRPDELPDGDRRVATAILAKDHGPGLLCRLDALQSGRAVGLKSRKSGRSVASHPVSKPASLKKTSRGS